MLKLPTTKHKEPKKLILPLTKVSQFLQEIQPKLEISTLKIYTKHTIESVSHNNKN